MKTQLTGLHLKQRAISIKDDSFSSDRSGFRLELRDVFWALGAMFASIQEHDQRHDDRKDLARAAKTPSEARLGRLCRDMFQSQPLWLKLLALPFEENHGLVDWYRILSIEQ